MSSELPDNATSGSTGGGASTNIMYAVLESRGPVLNFMPSKNCVRERGRVVHDKVTILRTLLESGFLFVNVGVSEILAAKVVK